MYFRDLVAPENAQFAATLPATKTVKLAALFAMSGLRDCATELLLRVQRQLAPILDSTPVLLARGKIPNYAEYIREFENDGPRFYPARSERLVFLCCDLP